MFECEGGYAWSEKCLLMYMCLLIKTASADRCVSNEKMARFIPLKGFSTDADAVR